MYRGITDVRGPVLTLGRPEVWEAEDVMHQHTGHAWVAPIGGARFWVVRLASTLVEPQGRPRISGARLSLLIRPESPFDGALTYAYTLIPERVSADRKRELTMGLEPSLKTVNVADLKVGKVGATIDFTRVFPVIQAYGAGTPSCGWTFQPHGKAPIAGCQFVYVVIAAKPATLRVKIDLGFSVEIETKLGPIELKPPQATQESLHFKIPE